MDLRFVQLSFINRDRGTPLTASSLIWLFLFEEFENWPLIEMKLQFDLTCDEEWKHTLANSSFLVGMLMGAVTLGNLADMWVKSALISEVAMSIYWWIDRRIGRRKTFTVTFALLAVCSTSCAFASDFWTFAVLRFFCGVFNIGFFLAAFVWGNYMTQRPRPSLFSLNIFDTDDSAGVEAVGSKYRMISDYVLTSITSIGSIALGVFAYFIRDWRTLQLVLSVPMFPLLIIPWYHSHFKYQRISFSFNDFFFVFIEAYYQNQRVGYWLRNGMMKPMNWFWRLPKSMVKQYQFMFWRSSKLFLLLNQLRYP